ncbi:bifunctional glutamate N-acetyltransferase/amino-acid acetyltransferase ArgJ [Paenibacillus xylaniclasticus]|uniref:bifunctional glutamate N-acetyltransferase/amino-acid acetyltransferase ArgJ n=1 Tax=Paenibacillus xylaniclasticus TaxID=588083 RepID=UPI0013DF1835|nr:MULTISPECIES: bifunctional glutamate N-acetyltransferase/amino-acid acetyltransferase ArgJ [Paenibacillus]GFN33204.1 arginine biosynthesis bifunctional protein ArgJ 2 [Paenibacillus curdlanolyticus]
MKQVIANQEIYITERPDRPFEEDQFYFINCAGEKVELQNSLAYYPDGIQSIAKYIGVSKKNELDFTVIRLDQIGTCSAVYTKNMSCSEAVVFDRANSVHGNVQLLCVISKNANVFTPTAREDIHRIAEALSEEFNVSKSAILLSCTGVIGVSLPMDTILSGIRGLSSKLEYGKLLESSKAILTTDRKEKVVSVRFGKVVLCGIAKGAGMIEPNMATMLVYLFTNIKVSKSKLDEILINAVEPSFNSITVDSDTSTSDTTAIFTTNEVEVSEEELVDFERAVRAVCLKLSRDVVSQAEGVTKLIEITVSSSNSYQEAKAYAKKIANSPLVKTAIYGADPNWGRVVMAIGKPDANTPSNKINPEDVRIRFLDQTVFDRNQRVEFDLERLSNEIKQSKTVTIQVEIGEPLYTAKVWGCDLTEEYIHINADYTT